MSRNWNEMGLAWATENVSENVSTTNSSQKRVVGQAQIAIVEDLDKFRAHFTDAVMLGIFDGTSVRVTSQNVCRPMLNKGKPSVDDLREAVYNRLKGIRVSVRSVTKSYVVVIMLPNGETYEGESEEGFQRAYVEAAVDMGITTEIPELLVKASTVYAKMLANIYKATDGQLL